MNEATNKVLEMVMAMSPVSAEVLAEAAGVRGAELEAVAELDAAGLVVRLYETDGGGGYSFSDVKLR